jgi:hypothetical protein
VKHDDDTLRVINPARERLATTRKRTLRSVTARGARSVWSECQSRVIESRNSDDRSGLSDCARGGSTDMHAVSRGILSARAMCMEAGPGSENVAEAYWGIRGSWESPRVLLTRCRNWAKPAEQRPGVSAKLTVAGASEEEGASAEPASEGNRSGKSARMHSRTVFVLRLDDPS